MEPNPYQAPREVGCELPPAVESPNVPLWVAILGPIFLAVTYWGVQEWQRRRAEAAARARVQTIYPVDFDVLSKSSEWIICFRPQLKTSQTLLLRCPEKCNSASERC